MRVGLIGGCLSYPADFFECADQALADAMNPTVDLGNDSPVDDGAESSIFPFMKARRVNSPGPAMRQPDPP